MKYQVLGDAELVKAYISGNEEALGILVNRYKRKVISTIYVVVKDRDIAEDLTQDTFIKAIHTLKSGRYNEEGKFAPWLMRIAHNLAIDHFRKNKKNPTFSFEDKFEVVSNNIRFSETSIEKEKIITDNISKLEALIEKLPENQKSVLMMRYFKDMSFKEIADVTGVSINTALGRMRYALINLRKEMETSKLNFELID